jgi:hypothetical protein
MYYGLPAARLPYAGLSGRGFGDYGRLGDLFTDLQKVAGQVQEGLSQAEAVKQQVQRVTSGEASVAVVPKGQATITIPVPGQAYGVSVPIWAVALGVVGLVWLLSRRG